MGLPILDEIIAIGGKVYDVIYGYINLFVNAFPFDDSRRTLALSILFFFSVIAIILFFNTGQTLKEIDIDTNEKQIIAVEITDKSFQQLLPGFNDSETPTPNEINDSETPTPPTSKVQCYTDQDCTLYEGAELVERLCCPGDMFENYACGGMCLNNDWMDNLDYCKHPGSCSNALKDYYTGGIEVIPDDSLRCDTKGDDSIKYCRENTGSEIAICCETSTVGYVSVCHGYCTKPGKTPDCSDINNCYSQSEISNIVILNVGDAI